MATTVTFAGSNYSIPAAGEVAWASLSNFLIAVATYAQTVGKQINTVRTATSTPVTVSAVTDYAIIVKLTVPGAAAVTLPTGVNGQIFVVADGTGDASTNNITVSGTGQNIAGSASYVIKTNRGAAAFQFSTTENQWVVVSTCGNVRNADIATDAAITRSKLATGIAQQVLYNDADGNIAGEDYLDVSRGGTGAEWEPGSSLTLDGGHALTLSTQATHIMILPNAKGSIVAGTGANASAPITVGANGTVLTADSAQTTGLSWTAPLTNPMNAAGDVIVGGALGAATKLAIGAANTVLTSNGTTPAWTAPAAATSSTAGTVTREATSTTNPSGTVTGGTISNTELNVARVGNVVTFDLEFDISGTPSSSIVSFAGALPAGFRPAKNFTLLCGFTATAIRQLTVTTSGEIAIQQRDYAGAAAVWSTGTDLIMGATIKV